MQKRRCNQTFSHSRTLLLTLAMGTVMQNAAAEENAIEFNGFLNVVGGILQHDPVKDFSDAKQYPGYQGYTSDMSFDPQTSAGIQAQKKLDDKLSVSMQLYAEGDIDQYQARLKWLYLTYTPNYHSTFRVGRIGAPVYYYSDFLNVGYSYHWVLPPEPAYPFDTTITGIDYVYQNVWNDIEWSTELVGGASDEYLQPIETRVITHNALGTVFTASTGDWLTFRAMLYRASTTFEMDIFKNGAIEDAIETNVEAALADRGYNQAQIDLIAPVIYDLVHPKIFNDDLDVTDFPIVYGNLALRAETARWLLMSELSSIRTDRYLFNDVITRYVTAGIHVGPALYHVTLADAREVPHKDLREDLAYTLPDTPQDADYLDLMAARLKSTLAGSIARNIETLSIGVRLETSANSAVKFEITHIKENSLFDGDTYAVGSNTLFRTALNATF